MPADYTGILGYIYSIARESTQELNTEVKIVVIGEKGVPTQLLVDKFFQDSSSNTDSSTGERFKYV